MYAYTINNAFNDFIYIRNRSNLYMNVHMHQCLNICELMLQYKMLFCLAVICDYNPCSQETENEG